MISNIYYFSSRWLFSTDHKDIGILILRLGLYFLRLETLFLLLLLVIPAVKFFLHQIYKLRWKKMCDLYRQERMTYFSTIQEKRRHTFRPAVRGAFLAAQAPNCDTPKSEYLYKFVERVKETNTTRGVSLEL